MSDYTDIQQELDDFENAVYGEEVRGSMISAIKKIHDVAESATGAPDATTAAAGQAPIADGAGGWAWGDVQGSGSGGQPTPVTLASDMTDTSKIYLYTGSESGYSAGHIYYHNGSAWVDGGQYGGALPSVTASDNGKFLRVVSGAWAVASVPSAESEGY